MGQAVWTRINDPVASATFSLVADDRLTPPIRIVYEGTTPLLLLRVDNGFPTLEHIQHPLTIREQGFYLTHLLEHAQYPDLRFQAQAEFTRHIHLRDLFDDQ